MKYLHTMIRVLDLNKSLDFYEKKLGLQQTRRKDFEEERFSLIYLATAKGEPEVELTWNWDEKNPYSCGRNFGHLAFEVDNIYDFCQKLMDDGVTILRPPRDGNMAFIRCPDKISIELLQKGNALPPMEPWKSMGNIGEW
ncbi:VOC family protein [Desulforhopalus vacuolatus]|uniref:VOC family protein n=1 Tax=Desulforhopalus vacuolatus TaxID=40414 RepID=UPI0019664AE7|nr:VOC family protein [Desulforhopalus vacuolatus]